MKLQRKLRDKVLRELFLVLALSMALTPFVLMHGCAALNKKPATPEASARTAIELLNEELNVAVDFYQAQKSACAQKLETCRFGSAKALDDFRQKLVLANTSFSLAVAAVEAYKREPTNANANEMSAKIFTAQQLIGAAKP